MKTSSDNYQRSNVASESRRGFRQLATTLAIGVISSFFVATIAQAASISQAPLFLTSPVEPNILFVIDDSGSMQWETMPDDLTTRFGSSINGDYVMWTFPRVQNIHGGSPQYINRRTVRFSQGNLAPLFRSPQHNTVYYNPAVTYHPWSNSDGSLMDPATPDDAPNRPGFSVYGTRDLTVENSQYSNWINDSGNNVWGTKSFFPATYYWYKGSGDINDRDNYDFIEIRPGNAPFTGHGRTGRSDCNNGSCTYAQEIQNFANWYSYHRNRIYAARAGIGSAFADQSEQLRVGYATINRGVVSGVQLFEGTARDEFFSELYEGNVPAAGTPLRNALDTAGSYFSRTDDEGPWSTTPGQSGGEDLECRQSFTVLMSDGYWSGSSPSVGNSDNTSGNSISSPEGDTFQYSPTNPFSDSYSNTLADVAMRYWKNDLRPDLGNRVPSSTLNPAFWQHMVTFTVGLAVEGTIDPGDAFAAIQSGDEVDWPNPHTDGDAAKIDDMLHAAVNARGGFFSAMNAQEFSEELSGVLQDIGERAGGSVTSTATNSGEAVRGQTNRLYGASFDSSDWTGDIQEYELNPFTLEITEGWSAAEQMPNANNRHIFSSLGGSGIRFAWNQLSDEQRETLGDEAILEYIRGDSSNEIRNGGTYRNRTSLIGDIINSSPTYQGPSNDFQHRDLPGYSDFLEANQQRTEVVYVGSNAGMLHAFDAQTGEEIFAYVPEAVMPNLSELAKPDYSHRFFVDGEQHIAHVRQGNEWKTILVGTLGAGGRGVYALDVTNPDTFSEDDVLWEISGEQYPDLGFTFGEPRVVRTEDDEWWVLINNGYDSDTGNAVLFAIDAGTSGDPDVQLISTGAAGDNGLSPIDHLDFDNTVNTVFAGDLRGNLWEFSLSDWSVSHNGSPLFVARDASGERQPITAAPKIANHPTDGVMVLVGTGQYFRASDNVVGPDEQVQTFYGVRSHENTNGPLDRSDLLEQSILSPLGGTTDRTLGPDDQGWFIDFVRNGERVVQKAEVISGNVEFTSLVPFDDPCLGGGTSPPWALDALTGARPPNPVFDLTRDGTIGEDDMIEVNGEMIAPSFFDPDVGIRGATSYIRGPEGGARIFTGTESVDPDPDPLPPSERWRERTWIELF